MYGAAVTGPLHQKASDQGDLCWAPAQSWRSVRSLRRTSPAAPPTVTARLDSRKDQWLLISGYLTQLISIHFFLFLL